MVQKCPGLRYGLVVRSMPRMLSINTHKNTNTFSHTLPYSHTHTLTHIHSHTVTHTHSHIYTHTHSHTNIHTLLHIHSHTLTHTHTHTHTLKKKVYAGPFNRSTVCPIRKCTD